MTSDVDLLPLHYQYVHAVPTGPAIGSGHNNEQMGNVYVAIRPVEYSPRFLPVDEQQSDNSHVNS